MPLLAAKAVEEILDSNFELRVIKHEPEGSAFYPSFEGRAFARKEVVILENLKVVSIASEQVEDV